MKQITVNSMTIEIERKRIKNMYLRLLPPGGRLHITAPMRISEDEIIKFILIKQDWIELQRIKILNRPPQREISYQSGDEIYYKGKKLLLALTQSMLRPHIIMDGGVLVMTVKEGSTPEQRKKLLDKWYKDSLNNDIPALLSKWENIIGVKAVGYSIRDMKTRWGTCNIRTKKLCFCLRLAAKPPHCLEYVIVHELVHLLEKSHNSIFKGYLDRFLPAWRSIKKELNA